MSFDSSAGSSSHSRIMSQVPLIPLAFATQTQKTAQIAHTWFARLRAVGATWSLVVVVAAGLLVSGCSSTGPIPFGQNAVATGGLSKGNFRIVRSNVRGDSYGFRLLGFIPIVPARVVDAKTDLYQKLDKSGDKLEGRSIALANATEDHNTYYFILGSVPRITLTADIIEFLDDQALAERAEKKAERARTPEPAPAALVPSSVLKPSALNSAPAAPTTLPQTGKPATLPTPVSPAQAPYSSGLGPIGQDAPIAEFDLPTVSPLSR